MEYYDHIQNKVWKTFTEGLLQYRDLSAMHVRSYYR